MSGKEPEPMFKKGDKVIWDKDDDGRVYRVRKASYAPARLSYIYFVVRPDDERWLDESELLASPYKSDRKKPFKPHVPKKPKRQFVILYESNGELEIEQLAPDYELFFDSEAAALAALKKAHENLDSKELETRAFECGPDPWEYFIAEIVRPVKIKYEKTVKVAVE